MENFVYQIKKGTDLADLGSLNYMLFPENFSVLKMIKKDIEDELVQEVLNKQYLNEEWKEKIYKPNKKTIKKVLGLSYDPDGNIKMSKKFKELITTWMIQIDGNDDAWVGFTSSDPFDKKVYYNTKILDKYCPEEIEELKNGDFIEKIKVD